MNIPDNTTLEFWADNNWNVLLSGGHGIGKSSIINDVFNAKFGEHGKDWLYFSAATLDPWCDFVGIPQPRKVGDLEYLELIRPKVFAEDKIKAIFFDELNRAPAKVRNAIMELIQFKSINGKKFHSLKVVWGAINPPEEGKYDVEELDPAQKDRFHIHYHIDAKPESTFFRKKFGDELAAPAIEWWKELGAENQKLVSPRRLDYALEVYQAGGNLRHVLPISVNVQKLTDRLKTGPVLQKMKSFLDKKNNVDAKAWIEPENTFLAAKEYIFKYHWLEFWLPLLSKERVASIIDTKNIERILKIAKTNNSVAILLRYVATAALTTKQIIKEIEKAFPSIKATVSNTSKLKGILSQDIASFGTYKRAELISDLATSVKKTVSESDIPAIFDFIEAYVDKTQKSSVNNNKDLQIILNKVAYAMPAKNYPALKKKSEPFSVAINKIELGMIEEEGGF